MANPTPPQRKPADAPSVFARVGRDGRILCGGQGRRCQWEFGTVFYSAPHTDGPDDIQVRRAMEQFGGVSSPVLFMDIGWQEDSVRPGWWMPTKAALDKYKRIPRAERPHHLANYIPNRKLPDRLITGSPWWATCLECGTLNVFDADRLSTT